MTHLADDASVDHRLGVETIKTHKLDAFGTAIAIVMASSASAAAWLFASALGLFGWAQLRSRRSIND